MKLYKRGKHIANVDVYKLSVRQLWQLHKLGYEVVR